MKLAFKPALTRLPSFHLSPRVLQALHTALWLMVTGLAVWILIGLFEPSPQAAPAVPSRVSANYQIDQSAEARLMGVETSGGLTPPSVNLTGVFAGLDGQGAAVLSIDGQPAVSRRIGDEIANGWMLDEVGQSFAVLRRNGQRHQVNLPVQQADPNLLRRVPANP